MRGADVTQERLFSIRQTVDFVPEDHPLIEVREILNRALRGMDRLLDSMYADSGRDSVPPERLLRGLVLQALYGIRSERPGVGAASFGYFSCRHKKSDTPPGGTGREDWESVPEREARKAKQKYWIPAFAGMTGELSARSTLHRNRPSPYSPHLWGEGTRSQIPRGVYPEPVEGLGMTQ